jgi:hypothetical protein
MFAGLLQILKVPPHDIGALAVDGRGAQERMRACYERIIPHQASNR